ncbi:MAG: serine/threonine-protein kinase [Myxococcales bacterium]|nr:serine/threonine-protein kinase [Myxococcales bacterium]
MERARARGPSQRLACVSCGSPVQDARCGYCGVAQEAGQYRVLQVLSRSGHGAVYLAEDESGARVALKEIVFSLVPSTKELDAFTREAELLRTLTHPALPKFRDAFTLGTGVATRLYLVQEYVPGLSLAGHLTMTRYDEDTALNYGRQVLEVLAYLHSRSPPVVHRDVKPANLVVTTDGFLKLVDLGAAREVAPQGTHRATLVGTFGYMAPEQLGGSVDARSDLYALGATLVHLLTRKPPEQLMSPGHQLDFEQHVNVTLRTREFLKGLTAVKPEHRFASAHEALAYLDGAARVTPASKRRWWQAGVAVSAALALMAGGAAYSLKSTEQTAPPKQAVVVPVAVTPTPPRPAPSPARPPRPRPGSPGAISFPWYRAQWDFDRGNGAWLFDRSGRGHDVEIPREGYSSDFFGLRWDGTSRMTIADHRDFFVNKGPMTIAVRITDWDGVDEGKEVTLMERSAPGGALAWRLSLHPPRKLRFTVGDGRGGFSMIEGTMPTTGTPQNTLEAHSIYALFDSRTGQQELLDSCDRIADGKTDLRPPADLGAGGQVTMLEGFRGVVGSLSIENMRFVPSGSRTKGCTGSGADLNVSEP